MSVGGARRRFLSCGLGALFTPVFIAGCITPPRGEGTFYPQNGPWNGRLALRLGTTPTQSFSAGFELLGNASQGALTLFTPIGSTAAALRWAPGSATLQQGEAQRAFPSLDAMVAEVTGTALPVAALFDWLHGRATTAPGWEADLSRLPEGRLQARRTVPEPEAELRIILDR